MNLISMQDALRSRIGNPTLADAPNATLTAHINSAYLEIADTFKFHNVRKLCRFTTVDGTKRYGVPEDCLVVMNVRDLTNETPLEKYGVRRGFEETAITTTGYPTQYARIRNWIELYPAPNGAYEIEMFYKGTVTALVADAESPALPVPWHEGIIRLAKYYYHESAGDTPKAIEAYNAYALWAETKPNEVDEEKTAIDSGVSVPTLSDNQPKNLDFNHSD